MKDRCKTQTFSVLIVEDDRGTATMLDHFFSSRGIETALAEDGNKALERIRSFQPDIIVLDIILPYLDGLSLLKGLRADGVTTPVILLTEKGETEEKLLGFEQGADDYITKPFSPRELLARIHAILRRARPDYGGLRRQAVRIGDLLINPATREITLSDVLCLPLTKTEFDLLYYLAVRRETVVTRAELLEKILGYRPDSQTKSLAMHIANIRKKLEHYSVGSIQLLAVAGVGYKLVSSDTEEAAPALCGN